MGNSKTRRVRLRGPFVLTVVAGVVACGGSTASTTSSEGAGGSGGGTSDGGKLLPCPTSVPGHGTSCATGAVCAYEACASSPYVTHTASCVDGRWQVSTTPCGTVNPPPPVQCPAAEPEDGTPCYESEGAFCSYDNGPCCPPNTASCVAGAWQVSVVDCDPPPPVCPTEPPASGAPCAVSDPCASPLQPYECKYGGCPSAPELVARCEDDQWHVEQRSCTPCDGLSFCECFDRSDCTYLSDTCICPCDYQCPGHEPCVCACGGGSYLGCVTR